MIFTKYLLSHFVDISHLDTEEICVKLSSIGLEVESSNRISIPSKVVVGRVVSKSLHPDADKLSVCQVDVGSEVLQIVCGAKNVQAEQYVAVALEGALIPHTKSGEILIQKTNLRGVESCGMLCSSQELGLPAINDGIMVLDQTAGRLELGKEVGQLPLFDDYIIDVSVTPNRGDCLSVLGIAREIATCYDLRLKLEIDMDNVITLGLGRVLQILTDEKIDAYLLYRVIEIKQAHIPLDIALILAYNGHSNKDTIHNFLEYGTYMTGVILNAYRLRDCESKDLVLDNGLVAQLRIKKDENGLEAVFSDKKLSVVGVYHGDKDFAAKSEIFIIEASYANPNIIAEALYEHRIENDPQLVYRTSRGSNPDLEQGIDFLCKKMVDTADVLVYSGTHSIMQRSEEVSIKTTFRAINQIIGIQLDRQEIASILKRLNFKLDVTCDENFFMISVPHYRHDIHSIQDIAEEVLRIYGIDNISSQPLESAGGNRLDEVYFTYKNTRKLAQRFITHRFYECIHYVFTSKNKLKALGLHTLDENLDLLNPITNELDTLRTSLLPSLLDSVKRNENLGFKNIALFEIGSAYTSKREERTQLAMVASGYVQDECYPYMKSAKWDLFAFASVCNACLGDVSLKNINDEDHADALLEQFGFSDSRLLHPYQSAFVYQKNQPIGIIAKLHPQIAIDLDLQETFICEVVIDMSRVSLAQASEFSKFQKSYRDLTILIDRHITFHKVREALTQESITYLKNIYPIDVYCDKSLGDQIALSVRMVLQSDKHTLQESELNAAVQNVLEILQDRFGAKLRV